MPPPFRLANGLLVEVELKPPKLKLEEPPGAPKDMDWDPFCAVLEGPAPGKLCDCPNEKPLEGAVFVEDAAMEGVSPNENAV